MTQAVSFSDFPQQEIAESQKKQDAKIKAYSKATYRQLSNVQSVGINWLWPGRIARGKVTMIAGDPGLGKSQISASISAVITTGGLWPVDRSKAQAGNVIILSAEDDAADTIKPRLEAAGADVTRCYVLDAITEGTRERTFNLAIDLERLGDLLVEIGDVALIIIDPVSAYLGGTDSHKNADVRALLTPLGKLASDHQAAILCVSHLNKASGQNALSRVTGSLAFVAAARAAYVVTKDPNDPHRRLFLPAKNNIGPDSTGLAYNIESATVGRISTSRIAWHPEPVTISADEAMAITINDDAKGARDEAADWIEMALAKGPVKAIQLIEEAKENGITKRTLVRAKQELGVLSRKRAFDGAWEWELPKTEECQAPRQKLASFDGSGVLAGFSHSEECQGCQECQQCHTEVCGTHGACPACDGEGCRFCEFEVRP